MIGDRATQDRTSCSFLDQHLDNDDETAHMYAGPFSPPATWGQTPLELRTLPRRHIGILMCYKAQKGRTLPLC